MFFFGVMSCYRVAEISVIPHLTFTGMNKDTLFQGFSREDSIVFYFELTDGDGDIGFDDQDTISKSILITDMRTGNISEQFRIPTIPDNVVSKGLQAEMQLTLYTTCCLFPDNIPPCSSIESYPYDTLLYQIVLIDRAGHKSEPVLSAPIILICN